MESMDYTWMSQTAPQPYQFLGYGGDNPLMRGGASNDGVGPPPSIENPLDSNAYLSGSLDYTFGGSFGGTIGLAPLPATSASPPSQHLSMFSNGSVDGGIAVDENERCGRRSSSEEKEFTPAKTRRKAQNRAAQRAFRERKERHVRDLEAKLNLLTTTTSSLQSDNERLKLMLQRAQTENEILRASASSSSSTTGSNHHAPAFVDDHSQRAKPRQSGYSPANLEERRFDTAILSKGLPSAGSSSLSTPSGDRNLLSASATWDLLQLHPLYLSGALEIGEVCERLKAVARRDGMGPMFEEDQVRKVIDEVGRSGGDELI